MLEAWFFIAAALLMLSGGSKLVDPTPTRGALTAAGLPSGTWAVYLLAATEVTAAIVGTVYGGWASLGVAIIYLGFAGFVVYTLSRHLPLQSCGCFGKADTPPTWSHVVFNLVSVAAATGIALSGRAPIDLLSDQPLVAVPYLAFVGLGVAVVYLLLAELPRLRSAAIR